MERKKYLRRKDEVKKKKRLLVAMVIFLSFFGSYELIGQEEVWDEEDLERFLMRRLMNQQRK